VKVQVRDVFCYLILKVQIKYGGAFQNVLKVTSLLENSDDKCICLNIDCVVVFKHDKFRVQILANLATIFFQFECIQQLSATLNDSTLCQYLILAYLHPDDTFKQSVVKYARRVPKLSLFLLKSDCWKEFSNRNRDLANSIIDEILCDQ
jgi:hypothetical protein